MVTPKDVADRIISLAPKGLVLIEFSNEQDIMYVNFHLPEDDFWEEVFHIWFDTDSLKLMAIPAPEFFVYLVLDLLDEAGIQNDFENLDKIDDD